ncbi:MAG: hypothetical protein WCI73_09955, partial [Phycisphaerae bacterium]
MIDPKLWLAGHLPAPLGGYAAFGCDVCMLHENFVPMGVIAARKDDEFEVGLIPCIAGFGSQEDKSKYIALLRAAAIEHQATMVL